MKICEKCGEEIPTLDGDKICDHCEREYRRARTNWRAGEAASRPCGIKPVEYNWNDADFEADQALKVFSEHTHADY